MDPIKIMEYKGYKINIYADEDAANPRETFEPLGKMVCWHRRYTLGDTNPYNRPINFLVELSGMDEDRPIYRDADENQQRKMMQAAILEKAYILPHRDRRRIPYLESSH